MLEGLMDESVIMVDDPEVVPDLNGVSVLIVEDEYLIAEHLAKGLAKLGATIVGPVSSVAEALLLIAVTSEIDVAVLDVNLRGEMGFSVADALEARRVPFAFATGYSELVPAGRYPGAPLLPKPAHTDRIARTIAPLVLENHLLSKLSPEETQHFCGNSTKVQVERGTILQIAGDTITHVHLPLSGLLAAEMATPGGYHIDVALIGNEGIDTVTAVLGTTISSFNIICRVPAVVRKMQIEVFKSALVKIPAVNSIFLAHLSDIMQQIAMTALSGACCSLEQRLARWLLLASDRIGTKNIAVTHEQLALSLNLRRAGITVAIQVLRLSGAITTGRGTFKVRNRQQLIDMAGPGYT